MSSSTPQSTLFQRVVEASGLAALFGASTIRRACSRAGVASPEQMSIADLERALPTIEQALRIYLPPDEVEGRLRAVRALAR
ncbi:MAG: hypothetical protein U0414_43625 [Polyangiaceae bacterium]